MPLRRTLTGALLLAVAAMVALVVLFIAGSGTGPRPSVLLIVADDLDLKSVEVMTRLRALGDGGVTFENMFVTTSLCCPSRVSILTGRYAHNHGVLGNTPPRGGFERFRATGGESSTLATWLKGAGYRTAYIGKYLNGYPGREPTHVPVGWDEWYVPIDPNAYYAYRVNENGRVVGAGAPPDDYQTDVLAARAVEFIKGAAKRAEPFFLVLAPLAPHWPAEPAARHRQAFADRPLPRPPSFNEADLSDKPPWLHRLHWPGPAEIARFEDYYRDRLRTLLAVDEAIERLVKALADAGRVESTVMLFTSDNGVHLGEHRLFDMKRTPYEEAIRVPLVVLGPGVARGRTASHLVLNIDLAPTLAELAGASGAASVDGRSLVPLLGSTPPPIGAWRQDFLIEHWWDVDNLLNTPEYLALRTADHLFVRHKTRQREPQLELYDLRTDPFQLESLHARAEPALIKRLSDRVDALTRCRAATCRE